MSASSTTTKQSKLNAIINEFDQQDDVVLSTASINWIHKTLNEASAEKSEEAVKLTSAICQQLGNLCRHETLRSPLGSAQCAQDIVNTLNNVLSSQDDTPQQTTAKNFFLQACRAIGNLTYEHKANREFFFSAGVVPALEKLFTKLGAPSKRENTAGEGGMLLRVAAGAVSNLAFGQDESWLALIKSERIVTTIVGACVHCEHFDLPCRALLNFIAGDNAAPVISLLRQHKIMASILPAMLKEGLSDRRTALFEVVEEMQNTLGRDTSASEQDKHALSLAIVEQQDGVDTLLKIITEPGSVEQKFEAELAAKHAAQKKQAPKEKPPRDAFAKLFTDIASVSHPSVDEAFAARIDTFFQMLSSTDTIVRRCMSYTIGAMCTQEKHRDRIWMHHEKILALLANPSEDTDVQTACMLMLANLASTDERSIAFVNRNVHTQLIKIASATEDPRVLMFALSALRNMSIIPTHKTLMVEQGVFEPIFKALKRPDAQVIFTGITCARSLMATTGSGGAAEQAKVEATKLAFVQQGGAQLLARQHHRSMQPGEERLVYEASRLIARLASSSLEAFSSTFNEDCLRSLRVLIASKFEILRKEAMATVDALVALNIKQKQLATDDATVAKERNSLIKAILNVTLATERAKDEVCKFDKLEIFSSSNLVTFVHALNTDGENALSQHLRELTLSADSIAPECVEGLCTFLNASKALDKFIIGEPNAFKALPQSHKDQMVQTLVAHPSLTIVSPVEVFAQGDDKIRQQLVENKMKMSLSDSSDSSGSSNSSNSSGSSGSSSTTSGSSS
eukprot:CAMPEP_0201549544 /NCGR_PEP_ID=MMETSP0173_2-20130828/6009_1 /ASSEMBLY_ACC=CAM_ASM_000268 /TAXON_ID=218659 /ORGANISM="Vexillifera sp., Strain DIVA3 564/2" /LENGTH=794 /DNA_ID=CAMNT_0047959243 /DNA_START=15 /DNA_END=2395 /DNA_ORIENTATION=+